MSTNLESVWELVDYGLASGTSAAIQFVRTSTTIDSGWFDGVSHVYFEIVATNSDSSTKTVECLYGSSTFTTIDVPSGTTDPKRIRSSDLSYLISGANTYTVSAPATTSASQLKVYVARIIVVQSGASKTAIQVPMTRRSINLTSSGDDTTAAVDSIASTQYSQSANYVYARWKYVASDWDTIQSSGGLLHYAVLSAGGASVTAYAMRCLDSDYTSGGLIASKSGTAIGITSSTPGNAGDLSDGTTYSLSIRGSSGSKTIYLYHSYLVLLMSTATKGETYHRMCGYSTTSLNVYGRVQLNHSNYTSPKFFFEDFGWATTEISGTDYSLYDAGTNDSGTSGSEISGSTHEYAHPSNTFERWRSSELTKPTSGNRLLHYNYANGQTSGDSFAVIQWGSSGTTYQGTANVFATAVGTATGSKTTVKNGTGNVFPTTVATATGSKVSVKQGTASIFAVASTGGVQNYSQDFLTSTADGKITSSNATYSTARSGSNLSASDAVTNSSVVGQMLSGGTYYCIEAFFSFVTSTIGAGSTITSVGLSVRGSSKSVDTDFNIVARIRDWGASLDTGDWVSGSTLDSYTQVAYFYPASLWASSGYNVFTNESVFAENVSKTGTTYIMLSSARHHVGDAPTSGAPNEFVSGYYADQGSGYEPKLHVEWTSGTLGPTGTRIRRGTANVFVCASASSSNGGTLTAYSSTADGRVSSYDYSNNWSNCRTGANLEANSTSTITLIGDAYSGGSQYDANESFFDFDTSSIGSSSTVTSATLSLYVWADNTTTDFVAQARIKDWGGTLGTEDWVAGGSLSGLTLVATLNTSGFTTSAYNAFTSETAFLTNVSKTGTTYLIVHSDRLANNNQPSNNEYFSVSSANAGSNAPKLEVQYSRPSYGRIRPRTSDVAVCAVATATGTKVAGGATKNATANVFPTTVATANGKRIRSGTANVFATVAATAGSRKPARSSTVVAVAIAANGARTRRATANVFAVLVAAAGSRKPARSAVVVTAVATAAGAKVRNATANVFATAVSAVNGSKIGRRTANVYAVAVSDSTGRRTRARTSDVAVTAVSASSGSKVARRTADVAVTAVATASGSKIGLKQGTANVFATAVSSSTAGAIRKRTSTPVVVAEATATGARVSRRTASIVAVASATAQGKNICAVIFNDPIPGERMERTVGGTIAWTCTPVANVNFALYAVARGTLKEYYLKTVPADGSGSYSTSDGFSIPPGSFRMKAVVS